MLNSTHLTLFLSLRSPFARRVRLALTRIGIPYREEVLDVFQPPSHFVAHHPLGLVPTLVGDGGFVLSDSAMILEWVHARSGGIYPHGTMEWEVRQASVLCEGVIQSTVLYFQEDKLHEVPSRRWMTEHLDVIRDTLQAIESMRPELFLFAGQLTQAGWDLCVALEYLTLRIPAYDWSRRHPKFNDLMKVAHQNQKFAATVPPP